MSRRHRTAGVHRSHSGFTLIEVLTVLALIAIITALAAPSFSGAFLSNKLASYANSFAASAQLARGEAIKRNAVVRICRSADGTSCAGSGTFQQGWVVFHDAKNDGAVSTGETIIHVQQALSNDYHFTSDAYSIAFPGAGVGVTSASLVLCRATPSPGEQERTIRVEGVGRAYITKTMNGSCP